MSPEEARRILGVSPNAGIKEIEKAYRELAWQFHPDRAGKSEVRRRTYEEKFKKINIAKDVLENSSRSSRSSSSGSSSSNSQRRNDNTSKNTNQENKQWDWKREREERHKEYDEQVRREERESTRRARERAIKAEEQVRKGKTILAIIAIISVLFIFNPFSNQTEIIEPVPIIEEPSVIERVIIVEPPGVEQQVEQPPVVVEQPADPPKAVERIVVAEQPVVKQAVADIPPPVEAIPTIEIVPIRSMILTDECESNAKEWGRENGRSEHAITEHIIFFGMYENVCAKAVVVFDLNEFEGLVINSMTFTFNDKIGSYGRTCHGDGFWTVSNARTCLEPTNSELKYKIQDSLSCMGDVFQESENWQNVDSWINPSGSTTISLDSIAVGEGRYLCMAFSQKGEDVATENDNYFRIRALGDFRIEATYIK